MGFVAVQNSLSPAQIPIAISLLMFGSNIGGALFLSFANTIFTNSFRSLLVAESPGVHSEAVISAGAYAIRKIVPDAQLVGVLKAYSKSIDNVFLMCTALAIACFLFAWFMGWEDIREKKPKQSPN